MFEKETKFIADFTLNRLKKLGSFFTYEELTSVQIHPAIILYISNKLDLLIYEDRKKMLQNSSFDYSGSEIAKYFNQIAEIIKKNKKLALEDVKTLVSQAVTFNVNYLVRPNFTLVKLFFDENKIRNVNEIRMMLNYLYYYDYVRNVFLGYFSKRKIISLSETEFGLILNKIDEQMFSEHTSDLIDNALVSIGDFFNVGGVNKTRISAQTIEAFLKEKNLMEALFKLRHSIPAEDKGKYDIEEIRKILYSKETVKVKKEEEPYKEIESIPEESGVEETINDQPEPEKEFEEEKAERQEEEKTEEDLIDNSPSEIVSGDDFLSRYESELKSLEELEAKLNDLEKEEMSEEEPDIEIENETDMKEKEAENPLTFEEIMTSGNDDFDDDNKNEEENSDELIIEEEEVDLADGHKKGIAGEVKPVHKSDIMNFITDKEMERIVSNVFNEDEDDFVNTMEKISDAATYDQATEILKAVFFSYKVSPFSKDAVALTNAVSNYFNQD